MSKPYGALRLMVSAMVGAGVFALAGSVRAKDAPALVLGYVVVPDLEQTLAHLDTLARTANPVGPTGGWRRALQNALGDSDLAQLRPGAPLVFVIVGRANGEQPPTGAWVLSVADPAPLETALARHGWKTK